jgi:hypothetical protein
MVGVQVKFLTVFPGSEFRGTPFPGVDLQPGFCWFIDRLHGSIHTAERGNCKDHPRTCAADFVAGSVANEIE